MKRIGWQVIATVTKRLKFRLGDRLAEVEHHASGVLDYKMAHREYNRIGKMLATKFRITFKPDKASQQRNPPSFWAYMKDADMLFNIRLDRVVVRLCDKCPWYEKVQTSFDMEQHRRLIDTWLKSLQENREGR